MSDLSRIPHVVLIDGRTALYMWTLDATKARTYMARAGNGDAAAALNKTIANVATLMEVLDAAIIERLEVYGVLEDLGKRVKDGGLGGE